MTRTLPPRLIALTPGTLSIQRIDGFIPVAARALAAGLRGILLREPALEDGPALELGRRLARLTDDHDAWLGIHDRVHLAPLCGARGVHLGFRSLPPAVARRIVSDACVIGGSSHAADDPERWSECDYVFHGPVHDTPSKRGLVAAVGLEGIALAAERLPVPVWGLGGVRPEHVGPLLAAGARGIAVLGGIFQAADPARAVREYLAAGGDD